MSLEVVPQSGSSETAALRALAHPLRLRMLSLLTGSAMSAAEIATELAVTHANASYHLRTLLASGHITVVEEVMIRGGRARRYRYLWDGETDAGAKGSADASGRRLVFATMAGELERRAAHLTDGPHTLTDAELWVDPVILGRVRDQLVAASTELHAAARPPRAAGTTRANLTVALFTMDDEA
jgi:DNA-binding transcriptional ArsR family regulator